MAGTQIAHPIANGVLSLWFGTLRLDKELGNSTIIRYTANHTMQVPNDC